MSNLNFTSTDLPQTNDPQEIQKANLSLLEKINKVAALIPSTDTIATIPVESKSKLICKCSYAGNGVMKANGDVVTWGQKVGGAVCALFNGVPTADSTYSAPFYLQRPAGETGTLVKIAMFQHGGCALYTTGNFYVAGYNINGGCGFGTTTSASMLTLSATSVIDFVEPTHTSYDSNGWRLWIKKTDQLWYVAGQNASGACGVGSTTNVLSWTHPATMGQLNIKKLYNFGGTYGCTLFITDDNKLYVAGLNSAGQFGNASTANATSFINITSFWGISPSDKIEMFGEFAFYNTAVNSPCTIFMKQQKVGQQGSSILASGSNAYCSLGQGNTTASTSPVKIKNLPENIDKFVVSGGGTASCYALTVDGKMHVWGYNGLGQLGVGNVTDQSLPQLITIAGEQIVDIFADAHGYTYSYVNQAIIQTLSGKVYAAGDNGNGQIGDGTAIDRNVWTLIPFDTERYGKIVDIAWNGYGDGGYYLVALTDKDLFFGTGYNGRQGLSLTGEAIVKSVYTKLDI